MSFLTPHRKNLYLAVFFLFSFLFLASPIAADEVSYLYDDAGRLVRVVKGAEAILYQYDEVGNLISISRDSGGQASPPLLHSIDPDSVVVGASYNVTITGENLLTTTSVTSDNPNIVIKNISSLNTRINATISITGGATPGQFAITVTTSYGSASIGINLYKVNIAPEAVTLFPGSPASLSVSLIPSAPKDVAAAVSNRNPDIIETQSSVTVPAGGSASLTVKAIKGGMGTIQIGSSEATVEVIEGGFMLSASPVSVLLEAITGVTVAYASPVGVYVGDIYRGDVVSHSRAVSAAWPVILDSSLSKPVSIQWVEAPGAISVSVPVCVKIEDN